jgi:transposase
MAGAYSHDLRVRVLDAVGAGLSRRAAALRYQVGIATVIRWAAHATRTGETRAQRQGRPPGSKLDEHEAFLFALIGEKDDITLAEMQERLRTERSVPVGLGTLWRFFARRAVTWKKSQRTQPSRIAPTWPKRARRGLPRSPTSIRSA